VQLIISLAKSYTTSGYTRNFWYEPVRRSSQFVVRTHWNS